MTIIKSIYMQYIRYIFTTRWTLQQCTYGNFNTIKYLSNICIFSPFFLSTSYAVILSNWSKIHKCELWTLEVLKMIWAALKIENTFRIRLHATWNCNPCKIKKKWKRRNYFLEIKFNTNLTNFSFTTTNV